MRTEYRNDILNAYAIFSPASVDVIARIEHMQQIPEIQVYCEQLQEEGLLVPFRGSTSGEYNTVEYELSDIGKQLVGNVKVQLCPAKAAVLDNLRNLERKVATVRSYIVEQIRKSPHMLSIIQLQDLISEKFEPTSIAEVHSYVYGLLFNGDIISCGPLFGILQDENV